MEIQIDKNIEILPIGLSKRKNASELNLAIKKLDIGDSILFDINKRTAVSAFASIYSKKENKKFVIRKVDLYNLRIWRTN